MSWINPDKSQIIIDNRIKIVFDNQVDRIVEKFTRFVDVFRHLLLKIRFNILKLSRKLINIFEKVKRFWVVAKVHAVKRVELNKVKRKLYVALLGKLSEFVRHTKETWPSIEGKTIFFYLIKPPTGLRIFFNYLYIETLFGEA